MENARIAVFEDDEGLFNMLKIAVSTSNHKIVCQSQTLQETLRIIDDVDFDVAIVDGNLSKNDVSCNDGIEIIEKLRIRKSGAKIIWFSSIPAELIGVYHDIDVGKDIFGAVEAIDEF